MSAKTLNRISHRERVRAVLRHEPVDVIPLLGEVPMDVTVFQDLFPAASGDPVHDTLQLTRYFDNSGLSVCINMGQDTISKDETHHCYRYLTGAVWRECYQPTYNREPLSFPIHSPEEAFKFKMPDVQTAGRIDRDELKRQIAYYHDSGYFVQGEILGAWKDIYYLLTSFDNILRWMALEPEAAHHLFDMIAEYSFESGRIMLDCGVDSLFTGSDFGSGQGLLFSPVMFREYVSPWLRTLADMAHERGAFLHLHCHGHIQDVMDDIVAAGVDIVNPVGPSDHNDLALFKNKWGDKIVLHGGISTTIAHMSEEEIRSHVREVMTIGRRGGRFIPRTESGVPPMPRTKLAIYLDALKEERSRGYF